MIRSFIAACLMWTCGLAYSAEGIDRLRAFLDGLQTLKADFVQTVTAAGGLQAQSSRGSFYLNRPARFRWAYTEPEGQLVVADGERVWLYDADLQQVSHQSQSDALRGTPALLLSDTGPIDKHFELIELGQRLDLQWLELIPRGEASEIIKVLVAFDGENLVRLEMIDSFGQVTRFAFDNLLRNPQLDDSLFRFDPPPEADILGR
jgi:outer membrane lipoprotein carrier protein